MAVEHVHLSILECPSGANALHWQEAQRPGQRATVRAADRGIHRVRGRRGGLSFSFSLHWLHDWLSGQIGPGWSVLFSSRTPWNAWVIARYKSMSAIATRATVATVLGTGDLASDIYTIATFSRWAMTARRTRC